MIHLLFRSIFVYLSHTEFYGSPHIWWNLSSFHFELSHSILVGGTLSHIWWNLSSFHFELSHSILVGGTLSHMDFAIHRTFHMSLAENFLWWTHNNLHHQWAHGGENYAHEHLRHAVRICCCGDRLPATGRCSLNILSMACSNKFLN